MLDGLIKNGQVRRVVSSWGSPVFLVPKPGRVGEWRMVADLRYVNANVVAEQYALPRIERILEDQANMRFWSLIDLRDAYWQIALHPDSQEVLAMSTEWGSYAWTVMPMGLHVSSCHFQKFVDSILAGIPGVVAYLDDIVIGGETIEQHNDRLLAVMEVLQREDLRIKPTKIRCGLQRVDVLGFNISHGVIRPQAQLVEKLGHIGRPSNKRQLREVLGVANFYRRLVPRFASIVHPLQRMVTDKVGFRWTEEMSRSFGDLRNVLATLPYVIIPDPNRGFILYTDANLSSIGGSLWQEGADGTPRPVGHFSRALKGAELGYSVTGVEALAIVESLEHWNVWTGQGALSDGSPRTVVYTDHKPLLEWNNKPSSMLELHRSLDRRYAHRIGFFSCQIRHIAGEANTVADFLTRRKWTILDGCAGAGSLVQALADIENTGLNLAYKAIEIEEDLREVIHQAYMDTYYKQQNLVASSKDEIFSLPQDMRDAAKGGTPHIDLYVVGWPCTPSSRAGKMRGAEDPRSISQDSLALARRLKRKNPELIFIFECVVPGTSKALQQEHEDITKQVQELGGKAYVVNMAHFVPQSRSRVIWTNIPEEDFVKYEQQRRAMDWTDVLQDGTVAPMKNGKRLLIGPTVMSSRDTYSHRDKRSWVHGKDGRLREMSLDELEAMQGLRTGSTKMLSPEDRRRAIGNALPPPFLKWVLDLIIPKSRNTTKITAASAAIELGQGRRVGQDGRMGKVDMDDNRFREVARMVHAQLHVSAQRTVELILKFFKLPSTLSKAEAIKYVDALRRVCPVCVAADTTKTHSNAPITCGEVGECMALDWVDMPTSSTGKDRLLIFTDRFSRFRVAIPCKKSDSAQDLAYLYINRVYPIFGLVELWNGDQDKLVTTAYLHTFARQLGMDLGLTSAYTPWSNGLAEAANKQVLNGLRKLLATQENKSHWDVYVHIVLGNLNAMPQRNSGVSPNDLVLGFIPIPPVLRTCLTRRELGLAQQANDRSAVQLASGIKRNATVALKAHLTEAVKRRRVRKGGDIQLHDLVRFVADRKGRPVQGKLDLPYKIGKVIGVSASKQHFLILSEGRQYNRNGRYVQKTTLKDEEGINQLKYLHNSKETTKAYVRPGPGAMKRSWHTLPPTYAFRDVDGKWHEGLTEDEIHMDPRALPEQVEDDPKHVKEFDGLIWAHKILHQAGIWPQYVDKGGQTTLCQAQKTFLTDSTNYTIV